MLDSTQEAPETAECVPPPLHLHSAGNHQHEAVGRENHLIKDDQRAMGRPGDHHSQAHEVPSLVAGAPS